VDVHPWTNYEIARMHDEERLKAARAAMRSLEAREARSTQPEAVVEPAEGTWLHRLRRRGSSATGTPARSGTS
jgi:hypothetical protein